MIQTVSIWSIQKNPSGNQPAPLIHTRINLTNIFAKAIKTQTFSSCRTQGKCPFPEFSRSPFLPLIGKDFLYESRDEGLLPNLQLIMIVVEKPNGRPLRIHRQTYRSPQPIIIGGSYCFPEQRNGAINLVTVHTTMHSTYCYTVTELHTSSSSFSH